MSFKTYLSFRQKQKRHKKLSLRYHKKLIQLFPNYESQQILHDYICEANLAKLCEIHPKLVYGILTKEK